MRLAGSNIISILVVNGDADDWKTVRASNLAWVFSAGDATDDVESARLIILTTAQDYLERGGIQFTWKEVANKETEVLKLGWSDVANSTRCAIVGIGP